MEYLLIVNSFLKMNFDRRLHVQEPCTRSGGFPYAENQGKRGTSAYSHGTTPKDKDDTIELVTNNANLSATQGCELYRTRWNIESFFKTIKQNLRIKSFLGTNKNAVMSQIWCAMIALLLLRHLKMKAKFPWHTCRIRSL